MTVTVNYDCNSELVFRIAIMINILSYYLLPIISPLVIKMIHNHKSPADKHGKRGWRLAQNGTV